MKLVSYVPSGRSAPAGMGRLGAMLDESRVLDLSLASGGDLPADMIGFLENGEPALARARGLLAAPPADAVIAIGTVRLLSPLPRPRKIIALARNYAEHAKEGGAVAPEIPTIFAKFDNAVVGPYDDIILPAVSEMNDFEAELAVVIGTAGRHISEADALSHVAGYTIANDVSVRDYQRMTTQFTLGKTFDTHCPMGPVLLTADEVPDPQNLQLTLTIDGEVMQDANTSDMVHSVASLIAFLSVVMTLSPGDVILTGTPGGVGAWRTPPRWIQAGERVRIEIPEIGFIENLAVAEAATA
jgi:acylpyruvate hydrolase